MRMRNVAKVCSRLAVPPILRAASPPSQYMNVYFHIRGSQQPGTLPMGMLKVTGHSTSRYSAELGVGD